MLVDNREILKKANLNLFNKLIKLEKDIEDNICIEKAREKGETLALLHDNKKVYLNSKYTPVTEASRFNANLEHDKDIEHIVFIGTAIGYHVVELLKKNPNITYSIYEPNIYVLATFLKKHNLSKLKNKLIEIYTMKEEIQQFDLYADRFLRKAQFVRWPVSNKLYGNEIAQFEEQIAEFFKHKKELFSVTIAHQRRWQINAIKNFPKILNSSSIFDLNLNQFQNKPVIIVSAGPSLSMDLHLIKQIKERGTAYIFAVGSGINALIEANITPDVFVSFDPSALNQNVFQKIKEKHLQIPLFFGSTIAFETLIDYPGPIYHFIVNRENISKYLLDVKGNEILGDKPSVAVMALEICAKFKMGPILLAGQNCGFLNNQRYADEIEYTHVEKKLSDMERKGIIEIPSVDGTSIETNALHLPILKALEEYIEIYKINNIYNTTKMGARIKGANFITLENIMENTLTQKLDDFSLEDSYKSSYDRVEVSKKYEALQHNFIDLVKIIDEIGKVLSLIIEKYKTKVYVNLNDLLKKYDKHFEEIHENLFYQVIVDPMVKFQQMRLRERMYEIREAKSDKIKLDKFMDIHPEYIQEIYSHMILIQKEFNELGKAMESDVLE